MSHSNRLSVLFFVLLVLFVLCIPRPAEALLGLGEDKEMDEKERQETIERIEDIQGKLKLLQEKLKALERRKAAKQAAERTAKTGETIPAEHLQVNWLPIDLTTINPGDFGLYTYLLYIGDEQDLSALGALEDLILTIETLPVNQVPESLANRFLVPVEQPQSTINLGRQPYDFGLSKAYLDRLQLRESLPKGPVLVSLSKPIDPYGQDTVPAFLAVSFGHQKPERALELAKIWHAQEKPAVPPTGHPVSPLFWGLLDNAGTVRVSSFDQRLLMELPIQP